MNEVGPSNPAEEVVNHAERRIYPIIIYPFNHPSNLDHLKKLYDFVADLDPKKYFKPITIINRQTIDNVYRNNSLTEEENNERKAAFDGFMSNVVESVSEVHKAWCVDTCQMWLAGFGLASDKDTPIGAVYWLIPGDFHYGSENGAQILENMEQIPTQVYDDTPHVDLVLGEISVDLNSAKQLIDTYGTYGLLYNWFPSEAQAIRKRTSKPRSEFFAISDSFLKWALNKRWYAYEQTIVLLLHAHSGTDNHRPVRKVDLGSISDDEAGRGRLDGAMQQVERTERVLKLYWRERHADDQNWRNNFRKLDTQSEKIRSAAMVIFEQVLA